MAWEIIHHFGILLLSCFGANNVPRCFTTRTLLQVTILQRPELLAFEVVEGTAIIDANWHDLTKFTDIATLIVEYVVVHVCVPQPHL